MARVVYNACYGGFGLSKEACQRYWDIKGQQVWIEQDTQFKSSNMFTVWLVSPAERIKHKSSKEFCAMSMDERIAYNQAYSEQTWYDRDVSRHDPVLVQVVEELGKKANGDHANLQIEIVEGLYHIDEYDGNETVVAPDGYEWQYADN
jgi:hypothetical protein